MNDGDNIVDFEREVERRRLKRELAPLLPHMSPDEVAELALQWQDEVEALGPSDGAA